MIIMGAFTTGIALFGGYVAFSEGGLPSVMYGRWSPAEPPAARIRPAKAPLVRFEPFSKAGLERAAREGKLVLLSVEAFWCGPCREMGRTVYADPEAAGWIERNAVPLRLDAQEEPELAKRYLSAGWPTTSLLLASGEPLAEATAMAPAQFVSWAKLVKGSLRPELEEAAKLRWADRDSRRMTALSREGARFPFLEPGHAQDLEDPVWGGIYRYAKGPGWTNPSHEKLLEDQTRAVETLSGPLVERTLGYVEAFLQAPGGGYRSSQAGELEKDGKVIPGELYFAKTDGERRALGLPAVDPRVFPEESRRMARAVLKSPFATAKQKAFARRTLEKRG
jgi:hypothetical protein